MLKMLVTIFLFFSNLAYGLDEFNLPKPRNVTDRLTLWATWYFTPQFSNAPNGIPLLDMAGGEVGPRLNKYEWCHAALEGSVNIDGVTYNFAGRGSYLQVDCSEFMKYRVGTIRYRKAYGKYGDGVDGYVLNPYRSLAVDPQLIPHGTVIYIPDAVGNVVKLPDGGEVAHDGFFYAADVGGAIEDNHVDVFIGISNESPFPWIKSWEGGSFEAFVVEDEEVTDILGDMHKVK